MDPCFSDSRAPEFPLPLPLSTPATQANGRYTKRYEGDTLSLSLRWAGRREPWERGWSILTLSLPECLMGLCKVTVTFESMDEIL